MKPRPLIFVDLDDTLFQTARKMPEGAPRVAATLDVQGQANGYMSPVQQMFASWLLETADVVPVTARSLEAYGRVHLPFAQGAICSHGGVILDTQGRLDAAWHLHMSQVLEPFQQTLPQLSEAVLQIGADLGFSLRGWVVEEQNLGHYVVTKHNEANDAVLVEVLQAVQSRGLLEGMQVHRNGNNLAFLPEGLNKRQAVAAWIQEDLRQRGERPLLGIGDSLTDLGFMDLCHFWATPAHSQLATAVEELLHG